MHAEREADLAAEMEIVLNTVQANYYGQRKQ